MKYVFLGTPRFARIVLENLLPGLPPLAAVTNPDRPAGRKQVLTAPAVKQLLAERYPSVELLQPEKPRDIAARLRELQPDLFIVAAYGQILSDEMLAIPRLGAVGVHPSLLPKYRGPTPFQSALLAGEPTTGVTLYLMDKDVDHGPILAAKELAVGVMDYLQLEEALAKLGAELVRDELPKFVEGALVPAPQDHGQATFTAKFESKDGFVPWEGLQRAVGGSDETAAKNIWLMVRALNPEPGAWTMKGAERIKLLKAGFQDGRLMLQEVQRAGKTPEAIAGPGSLP